MSKDAKDIKCPGCGGGLKEVYVEANYGRVLIVDQCQGCGGVWFDRWELYFLKDSSIRSLGAVDVKSFLSGNPERKGGNECPRCAKPLQRFSDPGLPNDALIERCPSCSGLWLNRGELGKYAGHREGLKGPDKASPTVELETLRTLQKELDASGITRPGWSELAELSGDEPVNTQEVLKDMGFLILQSLLRLVFKF